MSELFSDDYFLNMKLNIYIITQNRAGLTRTLDLLGYLMD
jgi:hypothetical protein